MTTFCVTPLVGMLARRLGWVYLPNDRTVHDTALPDIGGLAMYIGFVVAFMAAWLAGSLDVLFESNSEPWGVLIAATIIFVVGLIDDVRDISAPAKVFGAVLAGVVLVYFGVEMFAFRIPFYEGAIFLDESLSPLITVLWLVGMSQAINLIDGLDGLAAGIVGIGAVAFFLYSERLATLDLLDTANVGEESVGTTYFFLAPLAIPLLILGVPIFDTLFAIVRRATSGQGLASADKGHLHHRLMEMGHGHRRSVVILWTWTALLSAFVLYPTLTDQNPTYLPFGIAVIGIVLYTVLHPSVRARRRENGTPPNGLDRADVEQTVEHEQLQLDVSDENFRTQLLSEERDH